MILCLSLPRLDLDLCFGLADRPGFFVLATSQSEICRKKRLAQNVLTLMTLALSGQLQYKLAGIYVYTEILAHLCFFSLWAYGYIRWSDPSHDDDDE